ncbi:unnamed protein product [marine sediment metagenome]|uniref:Uncharacterized protein n=1 Tax=marine sediment metagenome TaxID=412755 RepID=X1J8L9_9ZZZZ
MAQYKLRDRCSGNLIEMGSGSMPEQVDMKMFIDTDLIGDIAKNIL